MVLTTPFSLFSFKLYNCNHAIKGVHNIWIALASGLPICPNKFDEYCKKVKDIYERAFWSEEDQKVWHPMCPSLHKILYHGGDIIRLLPPKILLGFLSEEPTERSFTNYTC